MSGNVHCCIHGDTQETFLCSHLTPDAVNLGFNQSEDEADNPFPDAWCDDCELIRAAHGGWTEEAHELVKISLVCAGCYAQIREHNIR